MPHQIVPASTLRPGPALVVVRLPLKTIRSRVTMVAPEPHGVTRVAFASGDQLTFSSRSVVGVIEPASGRRTRGSERAR